MNIFNEKTASADELWEHFSKKYQSKNPLINLIIRNFFNKIELIFSKLKKVNNVLEVGCGPGESSKRIGHMIKEKHFEVSEPDERLLTKLKQTDFPYKVIQESVYSLKRKNNEFDCVLLLEVLEHLEDFELALTELFRVSKKYVIISVPNEPIWSMLNVLRFKYLKHFGNTPGHINKWSQRELKKLISKYGRVLETYTPIPWIIVLSEKY